jgi:hypothetical protein
MDRNNIEPLLTRHALAPWLTERGFPISYSTLTKYCSPAINCGPPTEGYWGRVPVYLPSRALAWARSRLRPVAEPATANDATAAT